MFEEQNVFMELKVIGVTWPGHKNAGIGADLSFTLLFPGMVLLSSSWSPGRNCLTARVEMG